MTITNEKWNTKINVCVYPKARIIKVRVNGHGCEIAVDDTNNDYHGEGEDVVVKHEAEGVQTL